jgi:ParB family transcriptional regulator, chromosome partitioning protein
MQLEFHQLDRRWEHLRVRHPGQQQRLLASLAALGQQTPIIVVAVANQPDRYLVIDGYKRIAALQQLGRDTVAAVLWPISEAEALVLDRSLRFATHETALEQGWLLSELEKHFGYSLDDLSRRFDRSVSWVSRRLALVDLLPEAIQQQVRDGKICAHVAMKFLAPVARVSLEDCQQMAAVFAKLHCNTRQAAQLYAAWRDGGRKTRERILQQPELFLKAQRQVEPKPPPSPAEELLRELEMVAAIVNRVDRRMDSAAPDLDRAQCEEAHRNIARACSQLEQLAERMEKEQEQYVEPSTTNHDSGTRRAESKPTRDCANPGNLPCERTQSPALAILRSAGDASSRESRTLPADDPGPVSGMQGESRPGP